MEVKELFRMEFENPFKVKEIDGNIFFTNGVNIHDEHDQDWCESVYCDFGQVEELFKTTEFKTLIIEGVEGCGIKVNGFFIPCYDIQNGYYSSNLSLIIRDGIKLIKKIDISDFSEADLSY